MAEDTAEIGYKNIDNNNIYGLVMKLVDCPCKSGKDFAEQIYLKTSVLNKNINKFRGRDSQRGGFIASNYEIKENVESIHKN